MRLDELQKLGLSFIICFAMLKVLFYKEDTAIVITVVIAFFWLLVLPGFGITYLWDLEFPERFAVSIGISAAIMGIFSYYLGLIGVHVKTSAYVLPLISMIIGGGVWKKHNARDK